MNILETVTDVAIFSIRPFFIVSGIVISMTEVSEVILKPNRAEVTSDGLEPAVEAPNALVIAIVE